jgi:hypothetical protein
MKKTLYLFLFVQVLILKENVSYGQVHKLDSIRVEFEGFFTETVADVSCEAFSYTFRETKKVKVFSDKHKLSQLQSLMQNLKLLKEKKSFDVRGVIVYIYGKMEVKYCFDTFGYFYKDGRFYFNKNLLIAISDNVYNNHPKYLDTLRYHE